MALIFKHCTAGVCHFSPLLPQAAKNPCCFCYDGKMAFIYPHSLRLNHHARSEFLCFFLPADTSRPCHTLPFFISSSSVFLNNIFDDGTLAPGSGIKKMSQFFSYSFFFWLAHTTPIRLAVLRHETSPYGSAISIFSARVPLRVPTVSVRGSNI